MDIDQLLRAGGLLLTIIGIFIGGFWRMYGLIGEARKDAALRAEAAVALAATAREELSAHKLHTAETYVTKAGMQEQTAQIMKAIDGVSGKLDHLSDRIDGLMQPKLAPRTRSSG